MSTEVLVPSDKVVTHYAFHKSKYYKDGTGRLHPSAFIAPKVPGEISVTRISTLSEEKIWEIGHSIREKKAKARGDMLVDAINKILNEEKVFLKVVEDKKPTNPYHANIHLPLNRAIEKTVAQKLSEITKLIMAS